MAQESREFNLQDKTFCELFSDLADEIQKDQQKKREKQEMNSNSTAINANTNTNSADQGSMNNLIVQNQNWLFSLLSNLFVMIGLALFAFVVKYVFEFN